MRVTHRAHSAHLKAAATSDCYPRTSGALTSTDNKQAYTNVHKHPRSFTTGIKSRLDFSLNLLLCCFNFNLGRRLHARE